MFNNRNYSVGGFEGEMSEGRKWKGSKQEGDKAWKIRYTGREETRKDKNWKDKRGWFKKLWECFWILFFIWSDYIREHFFKSFVSDLNANTWLARKFESSPNILRKNPNELLANPVLCPSVLNNLFSTWKLFSLALCGWFILNDSIKSWFSCEILDWLKF